MLIKIIATLLFAVSFTLIMAWGTVKKQRQSTELLNNLTRKCEKRIAAALQREPRLSQTALEAIIKDTKASLFWSRQQAVVQDPTATLGHVLDKMMAEGKIEKTADQTYQWKVGGN